MTIHVNRLNYTIRTNSLTQAKLYVIYRKHIYNTAVQKD